MSVNSINAYSALQTQSTSSVQQLKQTVNALDSALKSGDLQSAKDAYAKLSQLKTIDSNSPLFTIGQALKKDDIQSALQVINPVQTNATDKTTPLAWQQLAKLTAAANTTESTLSANNKISSLLNYLASGSGDATSTSTNYTPGIINQVLSQINSASSTVSLGSSSSAETTELYSQLAQQIKNNPQLGAILVERLKAQSSNGVFSYL
jgi:hypothetical protein